MTIPVDAELATLPMFVDNQWLTYDDREYIESINPFTGRAWARVPEATEEDVDRAVTAARAALAGPWGQLTGEGRARLMRRLAALIEENVDRLARVEITDNGKLLSETIGVVQNLPRYLYYFAGAADKLKGETIPVGNPNYFVYTVREPIGVVAAIIPWNAPLLLLMFKLAPCLAAGCTLVAKTAEQTTASALEVARLVEEAGFPPGVFNVISGNGATTGRALVRHPGVDKVLFTGSTESGTQVMKDAADHLAPVSLELGGKSPNIVFADADLDATANGIVAGVFAAGGQMCVAGGRLVVERSVSESVVARVAERASRIKLGDPFDPASEMGPLATSEQRDRVLAMIADAQRQGARLVAGGTPPEDPELRDGYFVSPTIFADVTTDMRLAREEVFGPVLAVFPFDTEAQAVELANDTRYGLAAGVWTTNGQRAQRMARAIRAGTVWINAYRAVDPAVPFGGFGASGFGRENGQEVLESLLPVKAVWMELSGTTRDPFKMG